MEGGPEGGEEIEVGDERRLTTRSIISNTAYVSSHIHTLFHERKKNVFSNSCRGRQASFAARAMRVLSPVSTGENAGCCIWRIKSKDQQSEKALDSAVVV